MKRLLLPVCLLSLVACSRSPRGLSPEESLRAIQISDGFRVELFAAEPMVLDPVDMVFDESGRAYVADMLDLPYDPPKGKPGRSRIVLLEDTDGDGKADKSSVFAEDVLQVSGLMVWNGGLIVPSAPNIYYMKDTNGDGKADVREVLFTGFFTGNPEAQITNPRLRVDNWIYFSNTGNAGRITSPKWPSHPAVEVRGMDFRFHPVRNTAEPASGAAQFGSTFDDWGNRFISQNTQHLRHVVAPMNYLLRAPLLEVAAVNHDPYGQRERFMWPLTQPQSWRVERTRLRQARYDEMKTNRVEHVSGHLTGATGGTVYNGDAWPEEYRGSLFTGDVSGNLVRRDVLAPDGVTFTARPAREGVEFLASRDQWFRPTTFANAPDGNLYLTDMYREIIETPLSIPEELQKRLRLDFYRGDDKGRIYRIVPNMPRLSRGLRTGLGKAPVADLVAALGHANGWHRQTAQRLLVERQEKAAVPALREMAKQESHPLARLHALWTLEGIGALDEADLLAALGSSHAGIREHAVKLSESLPRSPAIEKALLARAADSEIRVRHQLAYTLATYPAARQTIAGLAAQHAADPWMRTATLSSAADWPADLFALLLARPSRDWQKPELLRSLGGLIGARGRGPEVERFLGDCARLANPEPALAGLSRGLDMSRATGLPGDAALARFLNSGAMNVRRLAWSIAGHMAAPALFARATREAADSQIPLDARAAAIGALRGGTFEAAFPVLRQILEANAPAPLQVAAIEALSTFRRPEVAPALIARWKSYPPEARAKAGSVLVAQADRLPAFLDALEQGQVDPASLEMNTRNRLLEDKDAALAARARKAFAAATADRDAVVKQYREVITLAGDVARGKQVFEETCAKCHNPRRKGGRVGPDLSGVNNKSKEELLEAILNPSRAIEPRFVNYVVTARDGQMYDGVLASETPGALTLRGGDEDDITILRANIQEIRSSAISLMPEDLEKTLKPQAMADVIAFLRAGL